MVSDFVEIRVEFALSAAEGTYILFVNPLESSWITELFEIFRLALVE
jgi:hypothetical protein